jgi:hypothetical protein
MDISPYMPYYVSIAVVTWATYLLGLVVYRLRFHPLSKFPGPKYAALSRWHEFYYEVVKKGQFTFVIQEYHKKYGKTALYLHRSACVQAQGLCFDIVVNRTNCSYRPR